MLHGKCGVQKRASSGGQTNWCEAFGVLHATRSKRSSGACVGYKDNNAAIPPLASLSVRWSCLQAYGSVFVLIGLWIFFRFVGPALGLYTLDAGFQNVPESMLAL